MELISQYVQLKKRGRNFLGLCPFHSEKEPSFTVSPEKQMFHCFGCKKGGDIFAFWMAYHGTTFVEALKDLAERYNIPFDEARVGAREKRAALKRQQLLRVNEIAADYFFNALTQGHEGAKAREYLSTRQIPQGIVEDFRLGYSPNSWEGLTRSLEREGVDLSVAALAGLVVARKGGGYYDRFRGRLMFPILNVKGQVVGFGGRALGQEMPKYLNTSETPVFHKSEVLYGLHASHQAIRSSGRVVVVEGYMDMLSLWKHGFKEVVATLGTALTEQHVRKLKGYTSEIVVVFDSDEAGKKAVLGSLSVFLNHGMVGKAVVLPQGHDPDTFVNQEGVERFTSLVEAASPMFDFYIHKAMALGDGSEEKVRVLEEMLPALAQLRSYAMRALYVRRLSDAVGLREEVVWAELKEYQKRSRGRSGASPRLTEKLSGARVSKKYNRDIHFLNLIVHHEEARQRLADTDWTLLLSDPVMQRLAKVLMDRGRSNDVDMDTVLESIQDPEVEKELREIMVMPSFYGPDAVETAIGEFEQKIEEIKLAALIREARERGDMVALNEALKMRARLQAPNQTNS